MTEEAATNKLENIDQDQLFQQALNLLTESSLQQPILLGLGHQSQFYAGMLNEEQKKITIPQCLRDKKLSLTTLSDEKPLSNPGKDYGLENDYELRQTQFNYYLGPGCSISAPGLKTGTSGPLVHTATITAPQGFLTAAHVVIGIDDLDKNEKPKSTDILSPSEEDSGKQTDAVGNVHAYTPISFDRSTRNKAECAFVHFKEDKQKSCQKLIEEKKCKSPPVERRSLVMEVRGVQPDQLKLNTKELKAWASDKFPIEWFTKKYNTARCSPMCDVPTWSPISEGELSFRVETHEGKVFLHVRQTIGFVSGCCKINSSLLGKSVETIGRNLGHTQGTVELINCEIYNFPYPHPSKKKLARFRDVIVVKDTKVPFANDGDSGSFVFLRTDQTIHALGIILGRWGQRTLVLPLEPALEVLGCKLCIG